LGQLEALLTLGGNMPAIYGIVNG